MSIVSLWFQCSLIRHFSFFFVYNFLFFNTYSENKIKKTSRLRKYIVNDKIIAAWSRVENEESKKKNKKQYIKNKMIKKKLEIRKSYEKKKKKNVKRQFDN